MGYKCFTTLVLLSFINTTCNPTKADSDNRISIQEVSDVFCMAIYKDDFHNYIKSAGCDFDSLQLWVNYNEIDTTTVSGLCNKKRITIHNKNSENNPSIRHPNNFYIDTIINIPTGLNILISYPSQGLLVNVYSNFQSIDSMRIFEK